MTIVANKATNVANIATLRFGMSSKLAELLFKDYRRRVLGLLLLNPDKAYHVREIARLTKTVAGTLHKELSRLAEAGVLSKETVGNQVLYRANRDGLIFEELASILRKTAGAVVVLADALRPLSKKIHVAFIFGSMASGKSSIGSDIDLVVIGDVSFSQVVKATYSAQEMLGREINPKVYNREEWIQMCEKNEAFIREVIEKPKLFVVGSNNELG